VNELLTLQREYELLELTIQEIAQRHQRTVYAILYKLEGEGFITSWNEARGFKLSLVQDTTTRTAATTTAEDDYFEYEDDDVEYDDAADEDYVEEEDDEEDEEDEEEDEENNEITKLTERVWSLETSVNDISVMVKNLFDSLVNTTPKKRPLSATR
jgi:DNA-binding PadR family transcriptional regulator